MSGRVGIIGGGGWLGGAIAGRGLAAGVLSPQALTVSARTQRAHRLADWPAVGWTPDNTMLAAQSDTVILSVRPQDFGAIDIDLDGKLAISVMAGVPMATLRRRLNTDRVIRTMPNAAAEIGRSFTPWIATEQVTAGDRAFVADLLRSCGDHAEVATEQQLDFLCGLSGTGPAYPALLAQALAQHAEAHGIPGDVALKAARGVIAACCLIDRDPFDPAGVVKTFTDYRGVTAAGLETMQRRGLLDAIAAGLDAAAERSARMAAEFGS